MFSRRLLWSQHCTLGHTMARRTMNVFEERDDPPTSQCRAAYKKRHRHPSRRRWSSSPGWLCNDLIGRSSVVIILSTTLTCLVGVIWLSLGVASDRSRENHQPQSARGDTDRKALRSFNGGGCQAWVPGTIKSVHRLFSRSHHLLLFE